MPNQKMYDVVTDIDESADKASYEEKIRWALDNASAIKSFEVKSVKQYLVNNSNGPSRTVRRRRVVIKTIDGWILSISKDYKFQNKAGILKLVDKKQKALDPETARVVIFDTPVIICTFESSLIHKRLEKAKINFIGDLVRLSEEQLLDYRLSENHILEIQEFLKPFNLFIGMDVGDWQPPTE